MRPALAISMLALVHASNAWAQTPAEVAARRGLLEQAEAASRAGDHTQALELGERAGRISMSPSLRLFLANEERTVGRAADALGNAELCAQTAERDTTLRNRTQLISQCRALIAELTPRVGRVTLRVAPPAPQGLQITLGGQPMSDAFWGVPFTVNPGHVVVEATAPGHVAFRTEVDVAAAATVEVPVQLADAPVASSPPPTSSSGPAVATASGSPAPVLVPPPSQPAPSGGAGPLPWIVVGLGVAGLGVGIASVALRGAALDSLSAACPDRTVCLREQPNVDDYNAARRWSTVATATFITGGVLVAGGLVWWLVARSTGSHPERHAHLEFAPTNGGAWVGLGGAL
jgi:hypothetical protein